jgi:hypothetical protein
MSESMPDDEKPASRESLSMLLRMDAARDGRCHWSHRDKSGRVTENDICDMQEQG